MKRLLCRWMEYHLALCEDDIGEGIPGWVRRHLQVCAHCQKEVQTYRRAREAMRQYAQLLPDTPPAGWRPLQVSRKAEQHSFPPQTALVPLAAVVVALIGFVAWQRVSPITGDRETPPRMVQNTTSPQQDAAKPDKKPAAPMATSSPRGSKPKPEQPQQPALPKQDKPVPAPHRAPPVYHPPKRVVIAALPKPEATSATDTEPVVEPSPELVVAVQPVVVEARPVTSTPVPEGYVIEAAYPATAGAVE